MAKGTTEDKGGIGDGVGIGERKVMAFALSEKVSINERGQYFARGYNQQLKRGDVESCERKGWIERTTRGTFRATPAGRTIMGLSPVQSTAIQRRVVDASTPPTPEQVIR